MTRRQRIDLALLLIIRRAERDAAVRGPSRTAEPDASDRQHLTKRAPAAGPADGRHLDE